MVEEGLAEDAVKANGKSLEWFRSGSRAEEKVIIEA